MSDFTSRQLRAAAKPVHRLGLALNYGIDPVGFSEGLERGINYVFWTPIRTGKLTPILRDALARDRERIVVATGPTIAFFRGNVRRGAERLLRVLGTDYLDVFHTFWLGVTSTDAPRVMDELLALKSEGKIRAIGVSIHDRERAGRLAQDSAYDLLMLRYNAAHPGAERDVFPHLSVRQPSVVAYTATSWRKLLSAPKGWTDRPMTAGECYRFCLSSPHVDVVLTGPKSQAELRENLAAVERGPLSDEELAWARKFGAAVHG